MQKIKIEMEIETNEESRVPAETVSNYVLRAIAGVTAANRAIVTSYRCSKQGEEHQSE